MATTAWRCSQCGAVNEAGTHACRDCGKWASLFDLQDTAVEAAELGQDELEPETFEPETFEPGTFAPESFEPDRDEADEPERARWKSILSGVIVPLALIVYFVISYFADR